MPRPEKETIFEPLSEESFRFECHKGISCFNKCCAALRLFLTPYDILRMKNRLGLSSSEFLEGYTETDFKEHRRFPMVRLKMEEDHERRACPFVTDAGCSIYQDRPAACRIYPLGTASTVIGAEKKTRERFFIVREPHCLGFNENKSWSLEEWLNHEGVDQYNAMNRKWLEIITSSQGFGEHEYTPKKIQMFFMASYNLDKFRDFLFQSMFFQRFRVSPELKDRMAEDDPALLDFAFDWLKFSLFGEQTLQMEIRAWAGHHRSAERRP